MSPSDLQFTQFSSDCILGAIHNLKLFKTDGSHLSSDHTVHATSVILNILTDLLTAIICHGHMSDIKVSASLFLLLKGRRIL